MFSRRLFKILAFISCLSLATITNNANANLKQDLNKKNNAEQIAKNKCMGYWNQAQYRYTNVRRFLLDTDKNLWAIETYNGECLYEKLGKLNANYTYDVCKSGFSLFMLDCEYHRKNLMRSSYTTYFELEGKKLVQYSQNKGQETSVTKMDRVGVLEANNYKKAIFGIKRSLNVGCDPYNNYPGSQSKFGSYLLTDVVDANCNPNEEGAAWKKLIRDEFKNSIKDICDPSYLNYPGSKRKFGSYLLTDIVDANCNPKEESSAWKKLNKEEYQDESGERTYGGRTY